MEGERMRRDVRGYNPSFGEWVLREFRNGQMSI